MTTLDLLTLVEAKTELRLIMSHPGNRHLVLTRAQACALGRYLAALELGMSKEQALEDVESWGEWENDGGTP